MWVLSWAQSWRRSIFYCSDVFDKIDTTGSLDRSVLNEIFMIGNFLIWLSFSCTEYVTILSYKVWQLRVKLFGQCKALKICAVSSLEGNFLIAINDKQAISNDKLWPKPAERLRLFTLLETIFNYLYFKTKRNSVA